LKTKEGSGEESAKRGERGGKHLKTMGLPQRHGVRREIGGLYPHTPGIWMDVKIKELREEGFVRV